MVKFGDLLDQVGPFGRYQLSKLLLYILCNLPFGWHMLSIIFVGGNQDYWCNIPELQNFTDEDQKSIGIPLEIGPDGNQRYSQCKRYNLNFSQYTMDELLSWNRSIMVGNTTKTIGCSNFKFDQSVYLSTIYSQFGLTCEKRWLVPMTQSVFMLGWFIGTSIFGHVSDKYGRRVAFMVTYSSLLVVGALQTFVPYIALYMVTKLIIGLAAGSFFSISLVLVMEVIGTRHRVWVTVIFHFGYGMSLFALPGIAYLVRDHFKLQLILGFSPLILLLSFIVVDESPRWLIQKQRFDDAARLLRKIAQMNKRKIGNYTDFLQDVKESARDVDKARELSQGRQPGFLDIVRIPYLRKITIIVFINWVSVQAAFYGLFMMPDTLGADAYVTTVLAGVAAPVAYCIVIPLMMKAGRRWSMISMAVATGICLLVASGVMVRKDLNPLLATIVFLARVFVQGSTCTLYLFTAELYPTVVRNVGVGAASSSGRVGALIGPLMALLTDLWPSLPILILGVVSVLGGVLNYFLHDTMGQRLPDTIEDGEQFSKNKKVRLQEDIVNERKALDQSKPHPTPDVIKDTDYQGVKLLDSGQAPLADLSDV